MNNSAVNVEWNPGLILSRHGDEAQRQLRMALCLGNSACRHDRYVMSAAFLGNPFA